VNDPLAPELQDLHAYVDNQLAPDVRRRVEARLAVDPQAQRQADDYAAIRDGLRALYAPVLDEPVPARLARRPRRRPEPGRWLRPLGAMAASVALLLVGGFTGMQWERSRLPALAGGHSMAREAAMAYVVYAPEVRHPVEVPGDQEQHLVSWLTKRLGAQLRAPRLDALGFQLLGGRLLASDDGPGALLMYEDTQGRRVVLYAGLNQEKNRDTAFRFGQEGGISVFNWVEGPLAYALAGEIGRAELLSVAEEVYRQITS
jgi:anti-sigma factor RsiW